MKFFVRNFKIDCENQYIIFLKVHQKQPQRHLRIFKLRIINVTVSKFAIEKPQGDYNFTTMDARGGQMVQL